MSTITFRYGGTEKTVAAKPGETILRIALDANVPMEHACGGNGFCTTCICKVTAGAEHLNLRNDREENMGITDAPSRLGCQARIQGNGDIAVEIPE